MPEVLISKSVAEIVTFWRPGSKDGRWTWADEYAELMSQSYTQGVIDRVDAEGIGFFDRLAPVLLGNDGRVWDGHHRICIAIKRGVHSLMCEVVRPAPASPTREGNP